MYGTSQNAQDPIIGVDTIEDIRPAIRDLKAGRYDVDEISAEPIPSGHTSSRWCVVIKWRDGPVFLEPDPQDARAIVVRIGRVSDGDQRYGPR